MNPIGVIGSGQQLVFLAFVARVAVGEFEAAAVDLADYVYILEYGQNKAEGDATDFAGDVAGIVRDWLRI
jgi:ABC-type branched-subunit amino acid transport system ATPase component